MESNRAHARKVDLKTYCIKTIVETRANIKVLEERLKTAAAEEIAFIQTEIASLRNLERFLSNEKFYSVQRYPEVSSFVMSLSKKSTPEEILNDAKPLIRFLSSPTILYRISRVESKDSNGRAIVRGVAEEKMIEGNRVDFLVSHLPHVIFIAGNNDLNQIDDLLMVLRDFKLQLIRSGISENETIERIANIPVIISGKGGHGVTPGPIFATSEAEAMSTYFQRQFELIIGKGEIKSARVYKEEQSTNTGQNLDFTKPIMRGIAVEMSKREEGFNFDGLRIWLIPTPVGGIRQLATVCQQAEDETEAKKLNKKDIGGLGYRVNSAYLLPDENRILDIYFSNSYEDACINMFAALRETVNYIGYMLDNDFMSPHAPDGTRLRGALAQVIKYYERLTRNKLTAAQQKDLADNLAAFSKLKEKAASIKNIGSEGATLIANIKLHFEPMKVYFQNVFSQVERQHMELLTETRGNISTKSQQAYLDSVRNKRLFDSYGLDPIRVPQKEKREQIRAIGKKG